MASCTRPPSILYTSYIVILTIISTLLTLTLVGKKLLEAVRGYYDGPLTSLAQSIQTLDFPDDIHINSQRNNAFRLAIFEDLHFGENEDSLWAPAQDRASLNVMATILSAESPDLVVLNGDLITGENTFAENSTSYLDMLVGPIVSSDIQFTTVYGNHDNDLNISTAALYRREKELYRHHSLTRSAIPGTEADVGVSNYFLPIIFPGRNSSSQLPDLLLWFFDSKGGRRFSPDSSGDIAQIVGQVDPSVVDWFQATSSNLKAYYHTEIPSLAFVHIPSSIMGQFQSNHAPLDPQRIPGLNQDYPMDCQSDDELFWQALVSDTSIKAVFSAHDHGDDWCMPYSRHGGEAKTFFCLGRHTGYGGYSNWMRGSRIVEVDVEGLMKGEIRTWIRLEDGTAGQLMVLNETYGRDKYEVVRERCSKTGLGEVPCDDMAKPLKKRRSRS